jgi:hypothetical protein
MKDGTQQVLVGLSTISGAVIIAAVVTQFYPGRSRQRLSIAFSEALVVAVIIVSALVTAATALIALSKGQEVEPSVIWQIASPLTFGVVLLAFLTMAARLMPVSPNPWVLVPVLISVIYLAAVVGLAIDTNLSNGNFWTLVFAVLGSGCLVAAATWRIEAALLYRSERSSRTDLAKRWQGPYGVEDRPLRYGAPRTIASSLLIRCWTKEDRVYVDEPTARLMQQQINERWDSARQGQAVLPRSGAIITGIRVHVPIKPPWPHRLEVMVHGREPARIVVDLDDGYFDITDTGLI